MLDAEIDQGRAGVEARRLQRGNHLGALGDRQRRECRRRPASLAKSGLSSGVEA